MNEGSVRRALISSYSCHGAERVMIAKTMSQAGRQAGRAPAPPPRSQPSSASNTNTATATRTSCTILLLLLLHDLTSRSTVRSLASPFVSHFPLPYISICCIRLGHDECAQWIMYLPLSWEFKDSGLDHRRKRNRVSRLYFPS